MKISYLIFAFSLIIGWVLPIHFPPWQTSYQEFITAFSLFLLLVILIKNKNNRIGVSGVFIVIIATIPAIQYFQNWIGYSGDMLHNIIYVALFGLSVFVGRNIEFNKQEIDFQQLLAWTFIVGALLSLVRPEQLPSRWSDWQFFGLIGAGFTRYGFASTCFLANSPEDSNGPQAFAAAVR